MFVSVTPAQRTLHGASEFFFWFVLTSFKFRSLFVFRMFSPDFHCFVCSPKQPQVQAVWTPVSCKHEERLAIRRWAARRARSARSSLPSVRRSGTSEWRGHQRSDTLMHASLQRYRAGATPPLCTFLVPLLADGCRRALVFGLLFTCFSLHASRRFAQDFIDTVQLGTVPVGCTYRRCSSRDACRAWKLFVCCPSQRKETR